MQDSSNSTRQVKGGGSRLPLLWIILGAGAVLLLAAVFYVGPIELLRRLVMNLTEQTKFAPGYSEGAFQKIAVGNSEADVRAALGAPLLEDRVEPYVSWLYAPVPSPDFEASGRYPDARFSFTAMKFSEDGVFVEAIGQISPGSSQNALGASGSTLMGDGVNTLGLTEAQIAKLKSDKATAREVEVKHGKPNATYTSRTLRWLRYSTSPGGENHRVRAIGIDRDGKVCEKQSEYYWD
jgi:hypothetical protein